MPKRSARGSGRVPKKGGYLSIHRFVPTICIVAPARITRRYIVRSQTKLDNQAGRIVSTPVDTRRAAKPIARPRVAILGAGPAGLGAAWRLARQNKADTVVIEQRNDVGGNSGSFDLGGLSVDYGSHRLHPSCQPEILADLRALLRDDLLDRPRHG